MGSAWPFDPKAEYILDNADNDVPGRTPMELAEKLIAAVKAEELIMSYQNGLEVPQPGTPAPRALNVVYADAPATAPAAPAAAEPAFAQKGRVPKPRPGAVEAYPHDLSPLERTAARPVAAQPAAPVAPAEEFDARPVFKQQDRIRRPAAAAIEPVAYDVIPRKQEPTDAPTASASLVPGPAQEPPASAEGRFAPQDGENNRRSKRKRRGKHKKLPRESMAPEIEM